jgi:hypothetical protein
MSQQKYKELIKLFSDGRKICNCGEAYHPCHDGCSANLLRAKYELAERVSNGGQMLGGT